MWETNLNINIPEEIWTGIWKKYPYKSISANAKQTVLKVVHQWHLYPTKLHRINKDIPDKCWTNCGQKGTLEHMWISSPKIATFWQEVIRWTETPTNRK